MKGASGGDGSDFNLQAVPGSGGGNAEGPRSGRSFVLGTTSRTLSEERVDLVGTWSMTSSERYIVWWC